MELFESDAQRAARRLMKERAYMRCLDIGPVPTDLVANIVMLGRYLARADPMNPDTWVRGPDGKQVDITPILSMSRIHRKQWEPSTYMREEVSVLEQLVSFHDYTEGTLLYEIMETPFWKLIHATASGMAKGGNKLCNICASAFLSRTSTPPYIYERHTFPPVKTGEITCNTFLNFAMHEYRLGDEFPTTVAGKKVKMRYRSIDYRIELLVKTGLVDRENADKLVRLAWQDGAINRIEGSVGGKMHNQLAAWDKLLVISLGCQASFRGDACWGLFERLMIQGGWGWLRGWPKMYGKLVLLVMASLFAAMRHGAEIEGVGALLLELATKLVGDPRGGPSTWKVRNKERLSDPKIRVLMPDPEAKEPEKHHPNSWSLGEKPAPFLPALPENIVFGQKCNHRPNLPFTARFRYAHSLDEVIQALGDERAIIVADTAESELGKQEMNAYVTENRILTVHRVENQCVSCAFRLAHAIGAFIVVI